jgi:ribosomal protein S18 acetylase RimI-like enzyme
VWARERGTLWERALTGEPVPQPSPAVPARWAEVAPSSAESLAAAMGHREADPVLRRMGRGARAFAGLVDEEIVCYGWVSAGSECIGELERPIRLGPGEAYVWDCLTLARFRRKGLYTALLGHVARALQTDGFTHVWIGSSRSNRPSIRGFRAAGFRPVVDVAYVRVGSISCLRIRRLRPASRARVAAARAVLVRDDERRLGPLLVGRPAPSGAGRCAAGDH